jgi:PAS domain S-box-containing protein
MPSGLIAVDLSGRVLAMNERAEELSGYILDDLHGTEPTLLDTGRDGIGRLVRRTIDKRQGLTRRESALRKRGGRTIPIACSTTLLRNPQDEVYGAIATFEDLTDFKAMEDRIRQLDRLAALGRFTAGVAHEIRNPLAGIAAGVQYLAKRLDEDPDQRENISYIRREIDRLNRIVEDLFRVTHPMPPRRSPENPVKLVEQAARVLAPAFEERGVRFTVARGTGEVSEIPVDPDQIQQVLLNLIKNALEATPPKGEVRVDFEELEEDGRATLAVRVEDEGPGIEADALPHIFEPFFTRGKAEGTGLGLYVSHGIVERHGGDLVAANRPDGGAAFTLKLPFTILDSTENAA